MAANDNNGKPAAPNDGESNEEITLQDLYQLTLSLKKDVNSEFETQKGTTTKLQEDYEKLQNLVTERGKVIRKLADRVQTCEATIQFNQLQIDENRAGIGKSDGETRRHNLIIYGIPEKENTSPREQIQELFEDMQVPFGMGHTDAIYRIGPKKQGNRKLQRPIFCQLIRKSDKGEIYKHVANLKEKQQWKRVSIGDDLTPEDSRNRQDLRDIATLAKKRNIDTRVSGNALVIDGKRFLHKDIKNLPHNLKLADAKQVSCKDGIAFQGPATYLSNLNRVNFTYEELSFTSVEQAYVYMKAMICGTLAFLSCIRSVHDPFRIKSFARKITATKEWEEQRDQILYEIAKEKFRQNPEYRDALLATGNFPLYEATRDSYYACGLPLSLAQDIDKDCPGKNIFGQILVQIRTELRLESQQQASSQEEGPSTDDEQ